MEFIIFLGVVGVIGLIAFAWSATYFHKWGL